MQARCQWVSSDPLYLAYHDQEWGVPVYDNLKLFAMLNLEGQQAGLSWITVLQKRERYHHCFFDFDPERISQLTHKAIERLLQDEGLIRNRLKLNSIVSNAQAYLCYQKSGGNFSELLWSFVEHKPMLVTHNADLKALAVKRSMAMAQQLKKIGFKFVGATICYAFMQAVGMIHEHDIECFRYQTLIPADK
jgi:DNA-3-methyladenine glycosylase I